MQNDNDKLLTHSNDQKISSPSDNFNNFIQDHEHTKTSTYKNEPHKIEISASSSKYIANKVDGWQAHANDNSNEPSSVEFNDHIFSQEDKNNVANITMVPAFPGADWNTHGEPFYNQTSLYDHDKANVLVDNKQLLQHQHHQQQQQ